jgi:hypothetical protein
MKRLLLLSTFLLISSFKVFAQTKEETIKWITEKIATYGTDPHNANCYPNNTTGERGFQHQRTKIVDGAIIIEQCSDGYDWSTANPQVIKLNEISNITIDECERCGGDYKMIELHSAHNFFWINLDWNKEPDLLHRMVTAFQHLASLNFTKQTF